MNLTGKLFLIISFITLLSLPNSANEHGFPAEGKLELFKAHASDFYAQLLAPDLNFKAFSNALKGYYKLIGDEKIMNSQYLSIADFSKSSNEKRYYLIDMYQRKVVINDWVAHGRNSGYEFATQFSNVPNSNMSSLGFFKVAESYTGKHGLSLRMDGLEYRFNGNARKRAIVIHGANYVSEDFVKQNGRMGRSLGCPAFRYALMPDLVPKIKNGTCFYIYHPDKAYETNSTCLQGDEYLDSFFMEMHG